MKTLSLFYGIVGERVSLSPQKYRDFFPLVMTQLYLFLPLQKEIGINRQKLLEKTAAYSAIRNCQAEKDRRPVSYLV